ncbi:hypothetical protein Tco_0616030 [Tanacetum coccineum]
MDVIWEDLNYEEEMCVVRRTSDSMLRDFNHEMLELGRRTMVKLGCCNSSLRQGNGEGKRPSMMVLVNMLKKLFLLHNVYGHLNIKKRARNHKSLMNFSELTPLGVRTLDEGYSIKSSSVVVSVLKPSGVCLQVAEGGNPLDRNSVLVSLLTLETFDGGINSDELGSHLRIEVPQSSGLMESLNDGLFLTWENESTATGATMERGCIVLRLGHVHFKRMQDMSKDGLIPAFDMDTEKSIGIIHEMTRPLYSTINMAYLNGRYRVAERTMVIPCCRVYGMESRGLRRCYVKRSMLFEPNDSVAINSIIESRDVIFDEHRSCFLERRAINDEMDPSCGNQHFGCWNDLPPGMQNLGCNGSSIKMKVDGNCLNVSRQAWCEDGFLEWGKLYYRGGLYGTNSGLQSCLGQLTIKVLFSMKDMGEHSVILGIRDLNLRSNGIAIPQRSCCNKGMVVSQLEYSRVIGCLMYAMTCTRPDIAFAVGNLCRASRSKTCFTGFTLDLNLWAMASRWLIATCQWEVRTPRCRLNMIRELNNEWVVSTRVCKVSIKTSVSLDEGKTLESAIPIEAESVRLGDLNDQEPT